MFKHVIMFNPYKWQGGKLLRDGKTSSESAYRYVLANEMTVVQSFCSPPLARLYACCSWEPFWWLNSACLPCLPFLHSFRAEEPGGLLEYFELAQKTFLFPNCLRQMLWGTGAHCQPRSKHNVGIAAVAALTHSAVGGGNKPALSGGWVRCHKKLANNGKISLYWQLVMADIPASSPAKLMPNTQSWEWGGRSGVYTSLLFDPVVWGWEPCLATTVVSNRSIG